MKILYGVQGTGNGHITRSRVMAERFSHIPDVEIDWLFSGRPDDRYFDMSEFGTYDTRPGITFTTSGGCINSVATVINNRYLKFLNDVLNVRAKDYDLVVTDFEPITAWAAKLRGIPTLTLGHQPSFNYAGTPHHVAHWNWRARTVFRWFAPADVHVGMHWSRFDDRILPPIIDNHTMSDQITNRKIVVYLPFDDLPDIMSAVGPIWDWDFHIYHPDVPSMESAGNKHLRRPSLQSFHNDVRTAQGVICGSGFELISECLTMGQRVLTKPVAGQDEQIANVRALQLLNFADIMPELNTHTICEWIRSDTPGAQIHYPDVATALANWIADGHWGQESLIRLSQSLWHQTRIIRSRQVLTR